MEIPDPYKKSREFNISVFNMLQKASAAWAEKLTGKTDV